MIIILVIIITIAILTILIIIIIIIIILITTITMKADTLPVQAGHLYSHVAHFYGDSVDFNITTYSHQPKFPAPAQAGSHQVISIRPPNPPHPTTSTLDPLKGFASF